MPIRTPKIESLPAQSTLCMRFEVPVDQIGKQLAKVLPAVHAYSLNSGFGGGMPFARYFGPPSFDAKKAKKAKMEAGVPAPKDAEGEGEIKLSQLPACDAVVAIYVGPYDDLPVAHVELADWAKAQGREPAGGSWEFYITDPTEEPDSSQWKTKIYVPLKSKA